MSDPWARFPIVEPAPTQAPAQASDPWAAFPIVEPAPAAAPPAPMAKPAPEPSLVDTIMGYGKTVGGVVDQAGRGVAEGVINMAGMPVDIANLAIAGGSSGLNWLLDAIGAPEGYRLPPANPAPLGGSRSMKAGVNTANDMTADALGVERPRQEPDNAAERIVHRIGEEIGATALPVAAATSKAAQVGVQGARQMGPLGRAFVEPAAVDASRFVGKEIAGATAAGLGAATANEGTRAMGFEKGSVGQQIGDLLGALFGYGGMAVGTKATSTLSKPVKAAFGASKYTDDVVRESVTDHLIRASGTPATTPAGDVDTAALVDVIMRGPRAAEAIPGFKESLGDRTGNAGIAALEYQRQSGPNAGVFAQRRAENTQAVDAAMDQSAPQGNPGALRAGLEGERDRRLATAADATSAAERAATESVAPLTPRSTPAARGNVVREELEGARDAARQRTDEAYKAADIDGVQVQPRTLTEALDGVGAGLTEVERGLVPQAVIDRVARLGRGAEPGPVDTGIVDQYGKPITREPAPPEPVDMKEATDLLSELKRLQRAALADPKAEHGGRNAARVLGQYVDAVDGWVRQNITPEQTAALDAARGTKFEEAEAFARKGDPVAAALARNEGGVPKMSDDRVAGSFVNPQAMDRLFTQADTPATRQAIREEVLSRADTSSAEGLQSFTQTYAEQLRRFPGLADELATATRARSSEATARTAETDLMREIGPQGRSVVAKYLQYGDENAEKAMRAVVANKDPAKAIDDLLKFVGDEPQAVEGARRTFWNIMQKDARSGGETTRTLNGDQPWMPVALKRFLEDPSKRVVAERLYRDNPEHWKNVETIADALQGVDLRARAKAPNTSGTAQGVGNVLTPETLQSRFYAWRRGQISGSFLVASIAAVAGRRVVQKAQSQAIERVLDEALLNPEVAAMLLKENNPANRAALARGARAWLGNEASTFIDLVSPREDDADLKEAIGR